MRTTLGMLGGLSVCLIWAGYKQYSLSSNEFSAYTVHDGVIYATDLLALDNTVSTSFTLAIDGNVNFFISDYPLLG